MRAPAFFSSARRVEPGVWATLASGAIWGTLPLYWYLLRDFSPVFLLCHRIVWSCLFLFPLVMATHRMGEVVKAAKNAKLLRLLFCSSVILGGNWGLFIWAVTHGRVVETSLGYFISPLITICIGVIVFRDRPSPSKWFAIALAFAGVAAEIVINGAVPWVGLALGGMFSVYVLLRKLEPVESLPGLALETLILCPFALAFIVWIHFAEGVPLLGSTLPEGLLLAGTGVVTSVPLVLYGYGARHLPFTTLGLLQYLSPLITGCIGLFVFMEPLLPGRMVSFIAIWAALAIYTTDSIRSHRRPMQRDGITVAPGRSRRTEE